MIYNFDYDKLDDNFPNMGLSI